jgi:carbon storage regulator
MLILSRREDEAIIINNDIKVIVLEIRKKQIRIGIEAPKELGVHREEIWLRIQEENLAEEDKKNDEGNDKLRKDKGD